MKSIIRLLSGVTNAGIHARPARENIFSKNVAHVLNDETQMNYIPRLKRLIWFLKIKLLKQNI